MKTMYLQIIIAGFFLLLISASTLSQQTNMLLGFFDTEKQEKNIHAQSPFFVTYQLLAALHQKAEYIVASSHLLRNIYVRALRFEKAKQKSGPAQELWNVYKSVNDDLRSVLHVHVAHKYSWEYVQSIAPKFSAASEKQQQSLQFDLACFLLLDHIVHDWYFYEVGPGVILCSLRKQPGMLLRLSQITVKQYNDSALHAIATWMKQQGGDWAVYITGHGSIRDSLSTTKLCGLPVLDMKTFLHELNRCKVKVCAYNSCYSGGMLGRLPLLDASNQFAHFSYPILLLSLLAAPTYVFGEPSGLQLPPYTDSHPLTQQHVYKNKLQFSFPQTFKDFKKYAMRETISFDLAQTLSVIRQCTSQHICSIASIENVPQILWPGARHFTLLPETDQFLSDHTVLTDFACKYLYLNNDQLVIPQVPGTWWYTIEDIVTSVQLQDVSRKFFTVPDLQSHFMGLCRKLQAADAVVHNVLLLHQPPFMPKVLHRKLKQGYGVYYERNGKAYCMVCSKQGKRERIYSLSDSDRNKVQQFIATMQKHAQHSGLDHQALTAQFDGVRDLCQKEHWCFVNSAYHTEYQLREQLLG